MAALNDYNNNLKNYGSFPIETSMRCLTYLATYNLHDICLKQAHSQEFAMGRVTISGVRGGARPTQANWGLGAKPPEAEDFCCFLKKITHFLGITCCYLKGFKSVNFLTFKEITSVKNIGCLFL